MDELFTVSDPLKRKIVCSNDCWNNHILANRPFMVRSQKEVENTLISPTAIYEDADFPHREVYYKLYSYRYMKVVVEFESKNYGHVVTAFSTSGPKQGEKLKQMFT